MSAAALVLSLVPLGRAGTIFPNANLDTIGPLGTPVTNIGISGGPSAADSWLQNTIVQDRFLTTDMVASNDPLPGGGGMMMRVLTNAPWTGSAGSGIGLVTVGDPLPVGSLGSIDLNVNAGTTVLVGWVVNNGGTAFDLGSVFVSSNGGWQRVFFTNNTTPTGLFEIEAFAFSTGATGGFDADNLQFTASPEPTSLALLGVGLCVLALLKPKRGIRINSSGPPRG